MHRVITRYDIRVSWKTHMDNYIECNGAKTSGGDGGGVRLDRDRSDER